MIKLPDDYVNRMKEQLGGGFKDYLLAMEQEPRKSLRINTLRMDVDAALGLIGRLEPNGVTNEGFMVPSDFEAGKSLFHAAGLFYMQEASAQLPARLLGVAEGMSVLDLCAAPGGKSTQLAAYQNGTGVLVANELVPKRAQTLTNNIERMGIKNAVVTCMEPKILCQRLKNCFDAVLVDAPCAGEGMFRKDERAIREWSKEHVISCSYRQREILSSAQQAVKAGGRLVYSTCSFSEEENEAVARWFTESYPEFEIEKMQRLYPHTSMGEGQFAAVFTKGGTRQPSRFCEQKRCVLPDGREFQLPPLPFSTDGLRLIRAGLLMGETRGKVFVPSHALAMADGLDNRVELSETEARRFMRGEMLEKNAEKGWCTLTYCNLPLGLGKATQEGIKNHLPKGLLQI